MPIPQDIVAKHTGVHGTRATVDINVLELRIARLLAAVANISNNGDADTVLGKIKLIRSCVTSCDCHEPQRAYALLTELASLIRRGRRCALCINLVVQLSRIKFRHFDISDTTAQAPRYRHVIANRVYATESEAYITRHSWGSFYKANFSVVDGIAVPCSER